MITIEIKCESEMTAKLIQEYASHFNDVVSNIYVSSCNTIDNQLHIGDKTNTVLRTTKKNNK